MFHIILEPIFRLIAHVQGVFLEIDKICVLCFQCRGQKMINLQFLSIFLYMHYCETSEQIWIKLITMNINFLE